MVLAREHVHPTFILALPRRVPTSIDTHRRRLHSLWPSAYTSPAMFATTIRPAVKAPESRGNCSTIGSEVCHSEGCAGIALRPPLPTLHRYDNHIGSMAAQSTWQGYCQRNSVPLLPLHLPLMDTTKSPTDTHSECSLYQA